MKLWADRQLTEKSAFMRYCSVFLLDGYYWRAITIYQKFFTLHVSYYFNAIDPVDRFFISFSRKANSETIIVKSDEYIKSGGSRSILALLETHPRRIFQNSD